MKAGRTGVESAAVEGADPISVLRASVVVATRDRASRLPALLGALERQTLERSKFEVVLVDDGSRDATSEIVEGYRNEAGGPVRRVRLGLPRGPAAARNAGWAATSAPIVAFTDDDCVPEPRWLESGIEDLRSRGHGVVMGTTLAEPAAPGYGEPFSRAMEADHEDGRYPTCNVFYVREALERARGFDESFRHACGEDTDLAWRVKSLGYSSGFSPGARVLHPVRPPDFGLFLRERRRFADQILLVRRHPHLRSLFYRRYFYRRSHVHAAATLVLCALAAAVSWRWLLPVPAIWVERLWRSDLGRGGGRLAAEVVVGDLWEFLVFCYWSVRYRALLL